MTVAEVHLSPLGFKEDPLLKLPLTITVAGVIWRGFGPDLEQQELSAEVLAHFWPDRTDDPFFASRESQSAPPPPLLKSDTRGHWWVGSKKLLSGSFY